MTVTVKSKTGLVVPPSVRRLAGLKAGDKVEFQVSGCVINIVPKPPEAVTEYTSAQRRLIDVRLAESEEDLKKGRTMGPFNTADEMIAHMKAGLKKSAGSPRARRSR